MSAGAVSDVVTLLDQDEQELLDKLDRVRAMKARLAPTTGVGAARLGWSIADVIARQKESSVRYATGFPTLDAKTRGGIPRRRMVALIGKPGVGKTSIASQMALHMVRPAEDGTQRAAVLAIFADSGMDDAAITIAQQLGCDRDSAERGDDDAVRLVGRETFPIEFRCIDPTQPYTVEEVMCRFASSLSPGVAPIVLVDSAQIVRAKASERAKNPFEKVKAVAEAVQAATNRYSTITLFISQANRASYRNTEEAEGNDPLAAGAGSAALEYAPDLHLFFDGGGKDDPIRMRCAKSRIGKSGWEVFLHNDFDRHRHIEIDEHGRIEEEERDRDEKRVQALRKAMERVLKELKKNQDGISKRQLREAVPLKHALVDEALEELYKAGVIYNEKAAGREGGGGLVWKVGQVVAA